MATWDGSYPEPDGSNYYANSYENRTSVNAPPCDYYVPNLDNTYSQTAPPFTMSSSMVFNQSTPSFYDSVDRNGISTMMTNAASTSNVYSTNSVQTINQVFKSCYHIFHNIYKK